MPKHVNVCSPFYDTHLCRIKYFDGLLLKSYQSVCVECQRGSLNANMTFYVIVHDLYSTMWSNVLLSHRRWQIWWKMQHGLERAANNNNKQTQHKWNLEKSDTSYYVDSWTLYTCDKKTTVSTNIRHNLSSLVPVSTYFNWAHTWTWSRLLPELTLIFGFCICQLAVHEK